MYVSKVEGAFENSVQLNISKNEANALEDIIVSEARWAAEPASLHKARELLYQGISRKICDLGIGLLRSLLVCFHQNIGGTS